MQRLTASPLRRDDGAAARLRKGPGEFAVNRLRLLAAALVLLAAPHGLADAPSPPAETLPVLDFSALNDADALRLHDQQVRAWVVFDGPGTESEHFLAFQCARDGDVSRKV